MSPDFIDRDISGILDADFAHFPSQYQPFVHGFLPPLVANRTRYVELKKASIEELKKHRLVRIFGSLE